ncbi:acyltransferase family protein [Erwinia pyrifoliae]|uniref:acyltransferase family protein n=1 Tax=Erwinia pyrifoliae TaxID=79967 RepID=UPI0008FFDEFE|nr:acyltransferase family protein [Erwinia pyrifoliae]AUX72734.1 hypothetical protein CPI84_09735 [Erwinia pyrifoliae]MCA8877003.1 acyltransferase family protein [Erwinia pyrifoliae]
MENKLISLQWLRAVAVLLVVGWHVMVKANVLNITSEQYFAIGNAGVDLFFIISGLSWLTHYKNKIMGVYFSSKDLRE